MKLGVHSEKCRLSMCKALSLIPCREKKVQIIRKQTHLVVKNGKEKPCLWGLLHAFPTYQFALRIFKLMTSNSRKPHQGCECWFCIFAMGVSIRNHPESAVRNGSGRVINQTITVCFFFPQRRRVSEESYILITYWDYKRNPTFYHCKQNLVESICSKVSPGTINVIRGTDSFKNVQIHHFRFGSIKPP